ncbi:hypothetical protein [Nonomuraea sp. NPDC001831]|uniref:hypothetical protein n=1 Tax=Nonomuraea sp. NPDC001831 TaxID=3364340 RepID=UPI00369C22A6
MTQIHISDLARHARTPAEREQRSGARRRERFTRWGGKVRVTAPPAKQVYSRGESGS